MDNQSLIQKLWWLVFGAILIVILFFCAIGFFYLQNRADKLRKLVAQQTDSTELVVPTRMTGTDSDSRTAIITTITDTPPPPFPIETPTATPPPPIIVDPTKLPTGMIPVRYQPSPLTLDGQLTDWPADTPTFTSDNIVYTNGWDAVDDSSVLWQIGWHSEALWIGATVKDDTHVQIEQGERIFLGDGLEIQLDTDRAGDAGYGLSPDDYQLLLSPGDFNGNPADLAWHRGTLQGLIPYVDSRPNLIRAVKTADGYTVEAVIPWLQLATRPSENLVLGATFNLNDNDELGVAQQPILKSSSATRNFADPSSWNDIILLGAD